MTSAGARNEQLLLDLLSVPGIADAELKSDAPGPTGVRVRLAPGADAHEVEVAVQRVLGVHGLRGRVGLTPGAPVPAAEPADAMPGADMPPPPPGAPGRVVPFRDRKKPPAPEKPIPKPREGLGRGLDALLGPPAAAPSPPRDRASPLEYVSGVAVEETGDGVMVAVKTSTGRAAARRARWSDGGLNEAIVAAVAALADEDPPRLIVVEEGKIDGSAVVSVLLERIDGERKAGSAVVENGAAFAVARAVWAALTGS